MVKCTAAIFLDIVNYRFITKRGRRVKHEAIAKCFAVYSSAVITR